MKSEQNVICNDFRDFRSDRTPPGPVNLLIITMVWGAFGRPGARRSAFSIFHEESGNVIKTKGFLRFYELS